MVTQKTTPHVGDGLFALRQTFSQIKIENAKVIERATEFGVLLNQSFESTMVGTSNLLLMGSWARGTAVPTLSDYDFAYELPVHMNENILQLTRRDASALNVVIEKSLGEKYSSVQSIVDEGVIRIKTNQGEAIDIRPALRNDLQQLIYLDNRKGGKWRVFDPNLGYEVVRNLPQVIRDNLIFLCRAARVWRVTHHVPISGILIDALAHEFIQSSPYRQKNNQYQDCLFRDFMGFLAQSDPEQSWWFAPESTEMIYRSGPFEDHAKESFRLAQQAIEHFAARQYRQAGLLWTTIIGEDFGQL